MNLTPELALQAISPATGYWNDETDHLIGGDRERATVTDAWDSSMLNPKNKIDSLGPLHRPSWRIDGCTGPGTQFFAIPIFTPFIKPLRVSTYLPMFSEWPCGLRDELDVDKAFMYHDSRITNFGIAQHVLRCLEFWSASFTDFETLYHRLPFGASIVFSKIARNVKDCKIRITQTHNLERQLKDFPTLLHSWPKRLSVIPATIDIYGLHLLYQIQDSTALVAPTESRAGEDLLIFKTLSDSAHYLYRELEILLTMPVHPNIISRPRHIVTKNCYFGGKQAVVGFTIPYHKQGSLRNILSFKRIHCNLEIESQLKWSIQIVEAIHHVTEHIGYYCDLRLDNILLSNTDDVVLVDFEQRGVLPAFASPLDRYLQYITVLTKDCTLEDDIRGEYKILYEEYIPPHLPNKHDQHMGYVPWLCMTERERESSTIYMLGRLLWCIFEGFSAPQRELWIEYLFDPEIEFPTFRDTPAAVRELILECTQGNTPMCSTVARQGHALVIVDGPNSRRTVLGRTDVATRLAEDWKTELELAKSFLAARHSRMSDSEGGRMGDGPSLADVLKRLQTLRAELNRVTDAGA